MIRITTQRYDVQGLPYDEFYPTDYIQGTDEYGNCYVGYIGNYEPTSDIDDDGRNRRDKRNGKSVAPSDTVPSINFKVTFDNHTYILTPTPTTTSNGTTIYTYGATTIDIETHTADFSKYPFLFTAEEMLDGGYMFLKDNDVHTIAVDIIPAPAIYIEGYFEGWDDILPVNIDGVPIATGSMMIAADTGAVMLYCETTGQWVYQFSLQAGQ